MRDRQVRAWPGKAPPGEVRTEARGLDRARPPAARWQQLPVPTPRLRPEASSWPSSKCAGAAQIRIHSGTLRAGCIPLGVTVTVRSNYKFT